MSLNLIHCSEFQGCSRTTLNNILGNGNSVHRGERFHLSSIRIKALVTTLGQFFVTPEDYFWVRVYKPKSAKDMSTGWFASDGKQWLNVTGAKQAEAVSNYNHIMGIGRKYVVRACSGRGRLQLSVGVSYSQGGSGKSDFDMDMFINFGDLESHKNGYDFGAVEIVGDREQATSFDDLKSAKYWASLFILSKIVNNDMYLMIEYFDEYR